ncbi:PREDICTED: 28S ribosomal protein S7, mitochondrial-like [Amphimedon queenslandica]|uniref:Ribosomal protein S7 n=1 Tax=Amphimedon queenslandica TaxID=400682 RepID=A0A1X7V2D5_AMPQE|nr:PREDICTED: 28S ribosomal protein S7, mitochondrial-like [Amphimedon queenslandica]|eukprot:XP_003386012.2 PREDICTED: 28S ribosomal protein S7, mitochondrial-like [Amphimedon queenslandica]
MRGRINMAAIPSLLKQRIKMFSSIMTINPRYFCTETDPSLPSSIFVTPSQVPLAAPSYLTPSFLDDPIVTKFLNVMMRDGKRSKVQTIFKKTLEYIKIHQTKELKSSNSKVETDPLVIFHEALKNITPLVGTTGVRKGGKVYQVPVPINDKRRQFLGMKWLIKAAERVKSSHKTTPERLGAEILQAYNNEGAAIKKKQDLHRLAEANRAFAHFRW